MESLLVLAICGIKYSVGKLTFESIWKSIFFVAQTGLLKFFSINVEGLEIPKRDLTWTGQST